MVPHVSIGGADAGRDLHDGHGSSMRSLDQALVHPVVCSVRQLPTELRN